MNILFVKGDRVKIKDDAPISAEKRDRAGIVTGYGERQSLVRVLWDGVKAPKTYHQDFLEKAQ